LRLRFPIPLRASYGALRWFHAAASRCMVSTDAVQQELERRGFGNLARWRRGVDAELFRPRPKDFLGLRRPVAAYVGRLAVDKNVDAFLAMPWPGTRMVIGDGPERARLQVSYPGATFVGMRHGEDLGRAALRALATDGRACREFALQSSWEACTSEFEANLVPAGRQSTAAAFAMRSPTSARGLGEIWR
jgi:glycosyltransferase involved in cell wall biosynthesis